MTKQSKKNLHFFYSVILAAMIVLCAVALIVSCILIYKSGDRPFTRESVSTAFRRIALPIFITLAGIVGGVAVNVLFPSDKDVKKRTKNDRMTLILYRSKISKDELPKEIGEIIYSEKVKRFYFYLTASLVWIISLIYPLIYALDTSNFTNENVNLEIATAAVIMILFLIIPVIVTYICSVFIGRSFSNELTLTKKALQLKRSAENTEKYTMQDSEAKICSFTSKIKGFFEKHSFIITNVLRGVILTVSVAFILLGVFNGGVNDVFQKAVRICTECIGMG